MQACKPYNSTAKISIPQMVRLKEVKVINLRSSKIDFNSTNGAIKSESS